MRHWKMLSHLRKSGVIADGLLALLLGNVIFALVGPYLIPPEWSVVSASSDSIWQAVLGQGAQIGMRLGLVLVLGILIWKWRTGRKLVDASITNNGRSVVQLAGIGVLAFCVASLPWKGIVLVNQLMPFGEGLHGWDYLNEAGLSAGLIAYVLVSAVLLPPILEELFVRGIWLNRIRFEFGPIGAIFITGTAFPLFHGHFYQADPVVLSQLVAFVFASCVWGWVTYRTGSVIPAVVAHALANTPEPTDPRFMAPIVFVMLVLAVVFLRVIKNEWGAFSETLSEYRSTLMPTLLGVGALGLLIVAVVFERSLLLPLFALVSAVVLADSIAQRKMNSQAGGV